MRSDEFSKYSLNLFEQCIICNFYYIIYKLLYIHSFRCRQLMGTGAFFIFIMFFFSLLVGSSAYSSNPDHNSKWCWGPACTGSSCLHPGLSHLRAALHHWCWCWWWRWCYHRDTGLLQPSMWDPWNWNNQHGYNGFCQNRHRPDLFQPSLWNARDGHHQHCNHCLCKHGHGTAGVHQHTLRDPWYGHY